jgi:hypothetical protein
MLLWLPLAAAAPYHVLEVLDARDQPVPCATITTTGNITLQTDRHGRAAFYEPGLMDQPVWFVVSGEGLTAPSDWLGLSGEQVTTTPGARSALHVQVTGRRPPCAADDRETRLALRGVPEPQELHALQVVDADTGRPISVVAVQIDGRTAWTDNGGYVTFYDLDDMVAPRFAELTSHGYAPATASFVPTPGASTTVTLVRTQLAERLYRITGAGRWEATVRLGLPAPGADPLLAGGVIGQDSALAVPWRGGLFWVWGDTNRASYALGSYQTAAATSALPAPDPERWLDLAYLTGDDGFVRGVAPPTDSGATWTSGLAVVEDQLVCSYLNLTPDWTVLAEGLAAMGDPDGRFEPLVTWPQTAPIQPDSTALVVADAAGDPWVLYRNGVRIPAKLSALRDPSTWQAWTPLTPQGAGWTVARTPTGAPDYAWRAAPPPEQARSDAGLVPWADSPWQSWDAATDQPVILHYGSVAYSPWRGRYVHIYTQNAGETSWIGELWYAESDTPLGPWTWSRHVVTHDGYTLYNPYLHPWFAGEGDRRLLFEGTLTAWLGSHDPIPRHDYNQLMFALQLDDPRVAVPVPRYLVDGRPVPGREVTADALIDLHAPDLPAPGLVPLRWTDCARSDLALTGAGEIAMWVSPTAGPGQVPVHRWRTPAGPAWSAREHPGWTREAPVGWVWPARWEAPVPVGDWPLPARVDAGPDRCGQRTAPTLVGHAEGAALRWTWDGGAADGATVTPDLGPGTHVLTLTATDAGGQESTDQVVVEILADGDAPELVEEPDPVPERDAGCGCDSAPGVGWLALVLGLPGRRRSRRPPQRL